MSSLKPKIRVLTVPERKIQRRGDRYLVTLPGEYRCLLDRFRVENVWILVDNYWIPIGVRKPYVEKGKLIVYLPKRLNNIWSKLHEAEQKVTIVFEGEYHE